MESFRSVTPDPPPTKPPSARFADASVVGAAAGRGLAILLRQLPTFLVIAIATYAPLFVFAATWDPTADLDASVLIQTGGAVMLQAILTAALTYGVVEELAGRRVGAAKSIVVGLRQIVPTVGLCVVMAVMFGAVIAAVVVPLALVAPGFAPLVGGIATMMLLCALFVAVPALVIERRGIGRAITRSVQLTSGWRYSIFGVLFVIGFVLRVVTFATVIVLLPPEGGAITVDGARLLLFSTVAILMLAGLVTATISIVTYALLRDEKDGVGAGELANVFD